jgi:hypothetical protein
VELATAIKTIPISVNFASQIVAIPMAPNRMNSFLVLILPPWPYLGFNFFAFVLVAFNAYTNFHPLTQNTLGV